MTAARPDTWMPIYWGDYARDTGHLNALAHGAYLMLIKHYWCTGAPLNDDDRELWRIACCDSPSEWRRIRSKLARFFDSVDGKWRHKRIDAELQRAVEITNKRSAAGRASATQRANKNPTFVEQVRQQTDQQTGIPSQSQSQEEKESDAIASPKKTVAIAPSDPSESLEIPSILERRTTNARGTRLPADWQPSPADRAFAIECGLDPDATAPRFRDYWHAKPGKDGVKLDWSATWRNWCRREGERGPSVGASRPRPLSPADALALGTARALAERERARNRGANHDPAEPLLDGGGLPRISYTPDG